MKMQVLAAAAVAAAVFGYSADASAASSLVTLRACNHTKETVVVGSSFIPVNGRDWMNKGWTTVNAHSCADIFKTQNHTFYVRAEVRGHTDQSWGSDIAQCVEYPGPYGFMTKSSDTTCPEGEPAQFSTIHSNGTPVFVWDLNP